MERCLIVGLGNPGSKYAKNRHNIGFMVLDALAEDARIAVTRTKFKGAYGTGRIADRDVVLLKPGTFMNLSGQSVVPAARFFGVEPENIVVIHDELDLAYGTLRLKMGGGHAGHNGLRSIINLLGSREFARLRVGIGRPEKGTVSGFVLADFANEERDFLPALIDNGADAVRRALQEGVRRAMNIVNAS